MAALSIPVAPAATRAEPVVAAYYAAARDPAAAAAVPARRLTHLLYAFAPVCSTKPTPTPRACAAASEHAVVLPDDSAAASELAALAAHKRARPDLKLLASVGGWAMRAFPDIAAAPERRAAFVASAVRLLRDHPEFDGIDVDWEFPGGGDEARPLLTGGALVKERDDHRALLDELRLALDRAAPPNRRYLLTAAVVGYPRAIRAVDWRAAGRSLDLLFVMTYDFTPERSFMARGDFSGGGGPPGHHANLRATARTHGYGADAMVRNLARAGVPLSKMVLGVGFYAREWADADWTRGRFPASASGGRFVGTVTWRDLNKRDLAAQGFRPGYDEAAEATYQSSPSGGFLSYEDPRAICAKGRFAAEHGLAGLFAWQIAQDDGRLSAALADAADGKCEASGQPASR